MMKRVFLACSMVALVLATDASAAAVGKPPGTIAQDVTAYLSGEAMNSAWHVVITRTEVGKQNGKDPAYQWTVAVYQPAAMGSKLAFMSPGMSGESVLTKVRKANGAPMYFPVQTATVVGVGEFRERGVQDAVVLTHEIGADCGTATVSVIGYNAATRSVQPRVQIANGCDLNAAIVKSGSLQAIRLTGPYYSKTAALCCPTKPHASATLAYRNGAWSVTPNYFPISPSR